MGVGCNSSFRRGLGVAALCCGLAAGAAAGPVAVGEPAPDFALKSSAGKNLRLSEYRGDVVLLTLGAAWCGDCRTQLPVLDELQRRYRAAGLQVIGVSLDDEPGRARALAEGLALDYPLLLDPDKAVARLYDPADLPLTLLLDRAGYVRQVGVGFDEADVAGYVTGIERLLDE